MATILVHTYIYVYIILGTILFGTICQYFVISIISQKIILVPRKKKKNKEIRTLLNITLVFVTRNCMMTTSLRCIQLFVTASCRYRDALRPRTSHSIQLFWHSVKDVPLFFAVGKRLSPLLTHVTAVITHKRNKNRSKRKLCMKLWNSFFEVAYFWKK